MLLKQHVAAVLSVYVCLLGRGSEGSGADVDGQRAQNKRVWMKWGKTQNEGTRDRKQMKRKS